MQDTNQTAICMTIDLKQNRLRIYKSVLRQLGSPQYIQLLVNPHEMEVAVRSVGVGEIDAQTHRISITAKNSVDITSMTFIRKLCDVVGDLNPQYSYRLAGKVYAAKRIAVFSLKEISQIMKREH